MSGGAKIASVDRPQIPAGAKRPKVGILYSSERNQERSSESCNLAFFLCGLLCATGYADMVMIPYENNLSINDPCSPVGSRKRIKYIPVGKNVPAEVPASDITFAQLSSLEDCDVIILTLNTFDTKPCCEKMAELLLHDDKKNKRITVFSIQRGVRNSNVVKEILEGNKGLTVLECVVGFAVVVDPKHSAYVSTLARPTLLIERIPKDAFKYADGPVRLLEVTDLDISFRKLLTPHAWGVLIYENLYVLNMLTKGSLYDTLAKREYRLILALMIRETRKTLNVAARDSEWQPDLLLVCPSSSILTPTIWLLEMVLVLPDFLFFFIYWMLGMLPDKLHRLISPGQLDLTEGRRSMLAWHFAEITKASQRYRYPTPVCALILQKLLAIEATMFPNDDIPLDQRSPGMGDGHNGITQGRITPPYNRADLIMKDLLLGFQQLEYSHSDDVPTYKVSEAGTGQQLRKNIFSQHPSVAEWWFWLSRIFALMSVILLLAFLFLHDY